MLSVSSTRPGVQGCCRSTASCDCVKRVRRRAESTAAFGLSLGRCLRAGCGPCDVMQTHVLNLLNSSQQAGPASRLCHVTVRLGNSAQQLRVDREFMSCAFQRDLHPKALRTLETEMELQHARSVLSARLLHPRGMRLKPKAGLTLCSQAV